MTGNDICFPAYFSFGKKNGCIHFPGGVIVISFFIKIIAGSLLANDVHGTAAIFPVLRGFTFPACFYAAIFIKHAYVIIRTEFNNMQVTECFVKSCIVFYTLQNIFIIKIILHNSFRQCYLLIIPNDRCVLCVSVGKKG
jgi:hypothetical protein